MTIESKQQVLTTTLLRFYEDAGHLDTLTHVLRNSASSGKKVSLRTLDWFVTSYAKRKNTVLTDDAGKKVYVFLEYKGCLKAFSKKMFDPFQRRDRLVIRDANGDDLHTTIGQLNFFKWAIETGVLTFTMSNIHVIEDDMCAAQKKAPVTKASLVTKAVDMRTSDPSSECAKVPTVRIKRV